MIAFGNSLVVLYLTWEDFKTKVASIATPYHYGESADLYELFLIDVSVVYTTQIHRGDIPISCSMTQEQNDAIKAEFEADYKSGANVPFSSIAATVTPTAPSNDYDLKPYGVCHRHINSSTRIHTITLTNKSDKTYTYSCLTTPEFYDCISSTNGEERDGILEVDTGTNEVTLFFGSLDNGTYKLIEPVNIDILLPTDYDTYYLWGMYFSAADYDLDDLARLQIVDVDNILGYGADFIVKEYDECWVDQINKLTFVKTPDGAPGVIPAGLYLRVKYYPKNVLNTDVKVWVDYAITIKN